MMKQNKGFQVLVGAANAAVAASLCALMVVTPVVTAEEPAAGAIPAEKHLAALTQQQKVLHALNRLTFGPKPGDEAAVSKMGLEAWFQMQLHPERIDDSAFEREMENFPAMKLTSAELLERFPSPAMIRQMSLNGGGMPGDAVEHAIYADSRAVYEAQRKKQEAGAPAVAAGQAGDDMKAPDAMAAPGMAGADAGQMQADAIPAAAMPAAGKDLKGKAAKHQTPVEAMAPEAVEAVVALEPEQRFEKLVAMSPEEAVSFRDALRPRQRALLMQGLTPVQVEAVAAMQGGPVRVVGAEALETRLIRDVASDRQLQAVMTDFWLNHFNVYVKKNQNEPYMLPEYQNAVILPNALGKFEDLLVATAKSPAMLMYLDNWQSIGPDSLAATRVKRVQQVNPNGKIAQALPKGINENYARELMELHTLGVGGGYTQKDVIEVAKCFTGWTIDRPYGKGGLGAQRPGPKGRFAGAAAMNATSEPGEFVFQENRHEPGTKTVLGHTIAEGGENEGLQVLHILATSPATAKFVSTKLAVRFVSDDPSPALVNAMAATFLKTGGDIKAVLTTMFHSPEFWSPKVYRAKVKTPLEFMASALRASDAVVKNPMPLVQAMERLGMPIYGMQTPNGYSWKAEEWVSSNALISRMNFALVLSGGKIPGSQTNWAALLGESGDSSVATAPSEATEKRLEALLLGQPAAERTRETVMAQFNNPTAVKNAQESFSATPTAEPENGMAADGGLVRAKYGRKGGGPGFEAGPETPLDTMAGLLLGSPEFQRR